ncbi:MAG TPA: NAD(P)H-binding protein, partial [Nakamurella sp.]
MTIAVTGATGHLGALIIDRLLATEAPGGIVAVVRDPAKASALADRGVRVRAAAYADRAALEQAFAGVDALLFVSSSEAGQRVEQHRNV